MVLMVNYAQHKANPIYDELKEFEKAAIQFISKKEEKFRIDKQLEDLSLKIAAKTRELSDLYNKFNQKLVKFKANKY